MTNPIKPQIWETPRRIAILVSVVVVVTAALAGWAGYDAARHPTVLEVHVIIEPGAIQITPDAAGRAP